MLLINKSGITYSFKVHPSSHYSRGSRWFTRIISIPNGNVMVLGNNGDIIRYNLKEHSLIPMTHVVF